MATLDSGASITINLDPGQSIVFSATGSGAAVYGPGNLYGQSVRLGGSVATIGPFTAAQAVYITSVNTLSYTVNGLTSTIDAATSITLNPLTATAYEVNLLLKQISQAGGGSILFPAYSSSYVFDEEILAQSNTSILLSPGVVITRPDPFTLTCTTQSGSTTVQVVGDDTARLKTGFYAAQYVVGTGMPLAARIASVASRTTFLLDAAATATGTVTLTFHYAHNIIRRSGANNVRIMAPWGRATLDGNGAASPNTFDSADALRNCIRTENCTDIETSGLLLKNAHFHGEIGTTNNGQIRLANIRTEANGYRGLHYHGDSPSSTITDMFGDELDSYGDGYKAWTINGDQLNTGFFLVYDAASRVQFGKIRVRRSPGIGFHMTGNISGGTRSNNISIGSIVAQDCGVPVSFMSGLKAVSLASLQASGTLYTLASTTLGAGTSQLPLWQSNGSDYVAGALMQSFVVPAGPAMSNFSIGQAVYMQDIASGLDVQLAIWSVDESTRTIYVFNYNSPTTRPWPIGSDGAVTTVTIWTSRGPGLYLFGNTGGDALDDISIGSAEFSGIGGKTISVLNRGAGVRYVTAFKIAQLTQRDCYAGAYMYNCADLNIGSVTGVNAGNRRTGNDTANVGTLYMQHCINSSVGSIYGVSTGAGGMTRAGAGEVQIDSACNNIKLFNVTAENGNASTTAVQATGTAILIGDPRTSAGASLTPFTTGGTNVSTFRYGLT